MKSWLLGISVTALLGLTVVGCASDAQDADEEGSSSAAVSEDDPEFETAEHRRGGRRSSRGGFGRLRRDGGLLPGVGRDGGITIPRDGGMTPITPGRDATVPRDPDVDAPGDEEPADDDDTPTPTPVVDAGVRDASIGTPAQGEVVTLPDGGTIQLDDACPNYSALGQTVVGCCLPTGACGLSTHLIDFPGLPKACGTYEQAKMLDPNFSLAARRCSAP